MPELPEVETVVRGLRDDVVNRTITSFDSFWPRQLGDWDPKSFAARIKGQRIETLRRRAKYIVFDLSDDVMMVHLKMTGRLYVAAPDQELEADRWLRTTWNLDDGTQLRFSDSRKFGRIYLAAEENDITGKIGPEPLSDAFTLDVFSGLLEHRSGTIKPLLLNQHFVAGVGNIYADEALWMSRIDPRRKADTLNKKERQALYQAIRDVLQAAIDREGASVSWYRKPDGTTGDQQNHFNAYDREGEPCSRCGTPITKFWLAQRGTHYCPHCQR